jgi:hypothetical protein
VADEGKARRRSLDRGDPGRHDDGILGEDVLEEGGVAGQFRRDDSLGELQNRLSIRYNAVHPATA